MAMGCIENSDYVTASQRQRDAMIEQATIDVALQTALALWQRTTSGSIAALQNEIAKRRIALAEALHAHGKNFWPYETALVTDAFTEPRAVANYSLASQFSAFADQSLQEGRAYWITDMSRRCLNVTSCEDARWGREAQRIRADVISFGDRQAEMREEAINAQRFSIQYGALGLGRDLIADVPTFQDIVGTVGANARGILIGTINSGLEALGYYRTRETNGGWAGSVSDQGSTAPYPGQTQNHSYGTPPYVDPSSQVSSASDTGFRRWFIPPADEATA